MYKIHFPPHRNSLSPLQDSRLMSLEEVTDVYCENYTVPMNRLRNRMETF